MYVLVLCQGLCRYGYFPRFSNTLCSLVIIPHLIHLMLITCLIFSYLLVVLATCRWNVIDVLGGRQVSGDIILILFCVPLVIHIHLANPCGHHHLRQRQKDQYKVKYTICFALEEENQQHIQSFSVWFMLVFTVTGKENKFAPVGSWSPDHTLVKAFVF